MIDNNQLLLAAVSALATVVVVLWRRSEREFEECRKDRAALWQALARHSAFNCPMSPRPPLVVPSALAPPPPDSSP